MIFSVANILTIGADLEALAAILGIITGKNQLYFLIPITAFIGYIAIYLILLVYIINAIIAHPNIKEVLLNTFIPHIEMKTAWIIAARCRRKRRT
ncbi:hypothetical protein [Lebetimonas sp. JH292]|uniref:hypothetical protein n=1 Tax=Lebetimonas sp. JH292 TaxID=990068 RepID=UPI000467AE80|nr:hypothetical protein [Lebetimonas sp. JH292]